MRRLVDMEGLFDVARYILRKSPFFSDKQVQKVTYYAYCWYIVKYNSDPQNIINRLVESHPEAWIHGPVFYELYEEMTYNRYGFLALVENLKQETKDFLDIIINTYGKYTGNQLEAMTHNELPWIEARKGADSNMRSREAIKDSTIYYYYSN